jgi:hypothetical protein
MLTIQVFTLMIVPKSGGPLQNDDIYIYVWKLNQTMLELDI